MYREQIERIFVSPPALTSERLVLRKINVDDFKDIYEYSCRDDVTEYLAWEKHPDIAFTRRYVKLVDKAYSDGRFFDWAVTLKNIGKFIGTCGFSGFDYQKNTCEIGYVINPLYGGNSYATEAAMTVISFAFEVLGAFAVEARCVSDNYASSAVMKKCGMHFAAEKYEFFKKLNRNVKISYYSISRKEYYLNCQ